MNENTGKTRITDNRNTPSAVSADWFSPALMEDSGTVPVFSGAGHDLMRDDSRQKVTDRILDGLEEQNP
jgi:hypothetical protein